MSSADEIVFLGSPYIFPFPSFPFLSSTFLHGKGCKKMQEDAPWSEGTFANITEALQKHYRTVTERSLM
jgi:hypothetical protein